MRRSTLLMCALLVTATFGCDRVKKQVATIGASARTIGASARTIGAAVAEKADLLRQRFLHKKAPPAPAPAPAPTPAPVAAAPTRAVAAKPGPGGRQAKPAPQQPPPAPPVALNPPALRDEPYVSEDTGTIAPGMHEKDVYSLWGPPVAVRHLGEFTFLYFKNGCEYSCGHLDVVILQNGQVVDAIVRWPGHSYSGQSSSPVETQPHAPPGGNRLRVKPDTTPTP